MHREGQSVMRIESDNAVTQWHRSGQLLPSTLDLKDGFIHLSPPGSVTETAALHFKPGSNILCVELSIDLISAGLVYEYVEGRGVSMPHLYAPSIPWAAVKSVRRIYVTEDGASLGPKVDFPCSERGSG